METLENEDLVSFINKEREARSKLNISKAYRYYCKCANKGIWEIYSRFKIMKDINIDIAILFGSNMIFHIFWVLINYTNNIKLTIFLIERAVLLFIEFVVMSRNSQNTIGIDFVPNIDVKREWIICYISRTTYPKHTKIINLLDFFLELIISKGQHEILSRSADSL